jgi:1-acyl-sn-glycerol-3-phosphate acyltransferase
VSTLARRALAAAARCAIAVFYRRTDLGGSLPALRPQVVVANHPNGLADPALLMARADRPLSFLAKAPLFEVPLVGWMVRALGCIPVWRAQDGADTSQNERSLAEASAALAEGAAIALFPEGRSHSEPELGRLKTGAARLVLAAEATAGFGLGAAIVPVGLHYRDKGRFRSRVAVWIGEPIGCGGLAELYARDPFAAATELTRQVDIGLRRVTLNLERWEDLPLLELAADLWSTGGGARVARLRRLAEGLRELRARAPREASELAAQAEAFRARLAALGLDARDLALDPSSGDLARFALRSALLAAAAPACLAALTAWVVPFALVRLLLLATRPDAETESTHKLLAGMLVYPAWLTLLCAGAWQLAGPMFGLAVLILAAPAGLAALAWLESERRAAAVADGFLRAHWVRGGRARLFRERRALVERIASAAALLERG